MKRLGIFIAVLFSSTAVFAASIPYCTHNNEKPPNAIEGKLLQKLVPHFAQAMGCKIGNNCIGKWNNQVNPTKYSIAWEHQCGPVIGGMYQLGDEGHGSTFFCQKNPSTGKTCCAPLGYDYVSQFVVCGK